VRAYDPEARLGEPPSNLVRVANALDACCGADVLVIATPWPEFARHDPASLAALMRGHIVLDPFGVLDASRWEAAGFSYFRLGRPQAVVTETIA
jgi:UDPglucose 6-dehydrogenase